MLLYANRLPNCKDIIQIKINIFYRLLDFSRCLEIYFARYKHGAQYIFLDILCAYFFISLPQHPILLQQLHSLCSNLHTLPRVIVSLIRFTQLPANPAHPCNRKQKRILVQILVPLHQIFSRWENRLENHASRLFTLPICIHRI